MYGLPCQDTSLLIGSITNLLGQYRDSKSESEEGVERRALLGAIGMVCVHAGMTALLPPKDLILKKTISLSSKRERSEEGKNQS